jgi:hypothetical protein
MLRRFCTIASSKTAGTVKLGFTASSIFGSEPVIMKARIFDTPTGKAFLASLPHKSISLTTWGGEVYGPCVPLPEHKPQPRIPPGGIAFSQQGNYLCVFYGQNPAWPVDYIGQIDDWEGLQKGGPWAWLSVVADSDDVAASG